MGHFFSSTSHGFPDLFNYIDNLIYIGLSSKIDAAFKFLSYLVADLGLEVSSKKLIPPSTSVICLGILIDSQQRTISISDKNWAFGLIKLIAANEICSLF